MFFDGIVQDYILGGVLPDMEPRVLRQHDHGQRQHLAVPDSRAAPLPVPLPQRLPVALPHPRLQRNPGRRGIADGNEGGFLTAPVHLTAVNENRLLIGLAERADTIVDFTNVPVGSYILGYVRARRAIRRRHRRHDFEVADPGTSGQILQFRVVPALDAEDTTPPQYLQLPAITPLPAPTVTRELALIEEASEGADEEGEEVEGPIAALLGTVAAGVWTAHEWMDPVTENPVIGATEVWEIYNTTADAHPMHIHEIAFEVLNREGLILNTEVRSPSQSNSTASSRSLNRGKQALRTPSSPTRGKSHE